MGIAFGHGDLYAPLPSDLRGRVDLLVANPPYLAEREYDTVPSDVKCEPRSALVAGPIGDEVLTRIAAQAADWLRPGGVVVCEIGEFHGARIEEAFSSLDGRLVQDLAGKDRFVVGRRRVE